MDNLNRVCPKCGASLHKDADFCPYCASIIGRRTEVKPRRPWLRIAQLRIALLLMILAAVMVFGWIYIQPRTFEGTGDVLYQDRDGSYQLLLSYADSRFMPIKEFYQRDEEGGQFRFPIAFFVNDIASGEEAGGAFLEKVESVTAEFLPWEDGPSPVTCTVPEENRSYAAEAALVTYVDYICHKGTSEMLWTFRMKNGDTIHLRTTLIVDAYTAVHYTPEEVPMDTVEDLQALIDKIGEENDLDTLVYIHLPPVTYEGDLSIGWRMFNLLGSTEGDQQTTFTGTVRLSPTQTYGVTYFEDIDFTGSGSGIGIASSVRLHLVNCHVSGWETGLLGYASAWVNVNDCVFEDNQVGLHFNSDGQSVSHTLFYDNVFRNNGTGILLESVPTDVTMDFSGTLFSGNGTDIDNQCNQPLDLSEVVFE